MRAVLGTNNTEIEHYILRTHQDILVLAQEKDYPTLKKTIKLHKPQLLIIDQAILGQLPIETSLSEIKNLSPQIRILWLFLDRKPTAEEEDFLKRHQQWFIKAPVQNHELSQVLYTIAGTGAINPSPPSVIAVWAPKSGDGSTLTAEAVGSLLYSSTDNEEQIGVLDFNLKAPYLKLRYGFDKNIAIDELIPYLAGGIFNAEILGEYLQKVNEGLAFLGGIQYPELHGKYNATHFNKLLEVSREHFAKVVIDAGSSLDNVGTISSLKYADVILAVIQPNYISKYALKDALRLFPAYGINPKKVKLVINRYVPEVFETPEVIIAGLDLPVIATLPELGPEANIISKKSFFEDKGNKRVASFNQALQDSLKEAGLLPENDQGRKTILPKLLARRYAN